MEFPNIDYTFWLTNWGQSIGQYKTYTNKNMAEYIVFDGDINACTAEIAQLVQSNKRDKQTVLRVVDLIYAWGGRSGRLFYATTKKGIAPRKELAESDAVFTKYVSAVDLAKKGDPNSIHKFCELRGIGPSYGSKHAYFWSLHSDNPLIIVDSKIAGALGHNTINQLNRDRSYEQIVTAFKDKAVEVFGESNPSNVERALFAFHNHYFLNDNTGWKNNVKGHDYDEATRLATVLFQ